MFSNYNEQAFGGNVLKKVKAANKKLGTALNAPLKAAIKDPKSLLNVKKQIKMGSKMGQALEQAVVAANPLDKPMQLLNQKIIKMGGIGKFLGRTGEKVRTHPVATVAIVVGTVIGATELYAAYGGTTAVGTGASVATTGTGSAGWLAAAEVYGPTAASLAGKLVAQGKKPEDITGEDVFNEPEGMKLLAEKEEASTVEKLIATVGPAGLLLLLL
jgi:hypothetical protein